MEAARSGGAPPGATALSFRSWPAQKPRPAPVITSTRAGWSFRLASAARTSACISVLKLRSEERRVGTEGGTWRARDGDSTSEARALRVGRQGQTGADG